MTMNLLDTCEDFLPVAVEGSGQAAAERTPPPAVPTDPDPDWLPL
ncbi:hypothetical protein [Oleiagrimonas sp.]|nr:hypothetical protein [Oleiagrimonas sp.]MDA3913088.1 hypothetical protein [Oleiagrimonas sp.]